MKGLKVVLWILAILCLLCFLGVIFPWSWTSKIASIWGYGDIRAIFSSCRKIGFELSYGNMVVWGGRLRRECGMSVANGAFPVMRCCDPFP